MRAVFALLAAGWFLGAATLRAESAEEAARRFVTLAYAGRFDELPKAHQAETQAFVRKVRNTLRSRCADVASVIVDEVMAGGDAAAVALQVAVEKREKDAADGWADTEAFPLRIKLTRGDGRWLVSSIEFPDQQLAGQLLAAAGEERARLLREHPERVSRSLARALYDRGLGLLNAGKFDDALRAASFTREIAIAAGDRGGEALALGVAMYTMPEGPAATQLSSEGLAIAESLGDPDVLARAWYNRGRSFAKVGQMVAPETTAAYRKALTFAERAEDPTLLIRTLYSMANIAAATMDHVTARSYIDRMYPIAREIGDAGGLIGGDTVLASIYFQQGDRERGHFHHARAMEVAEKHAQFSYANLVLRSAALMVEEERFDEARAAFAKILSRNERGVMTATTRIHGAHIGSALLSMAMIEKNAGRLDEAECLTRESARVRGMDDAALLYALADVHMKRGSYATALRLALQSLSESRLYSDYAADALRDAARAYRGLGDHDRAMATIVEAIDLRESLNEQTAGDEQQQAGASDRSANYYRLAAEIALDGGDPATALRFLERGRAGVLKNILEHGRPGAIAEADAADRDEQTRQERELARLSIELDRANANGSRTAADASALRLREARASYATFVDGIRARAQRRAATRTRANDRPLADVAAQLPAQTIAIEYFLTDTHLHLFVAGGSGVSHQSVPVDRTAAEAAITRFVDALSGRRIAVRQPAKALYALLVKPVEHHLARANAVLVIPDGAIWRVPFAALVDDRERFLIERTAIVYAPSITAYTLMAEPRSNTPAQQASVFAVANPVIDGGSREAFTSFYRNATLGALPDAEREVDALRALYGRSLVLKGAEATELRTKAEVGGASVVHFATHALFDDANPMYSRLALARDPATPDDGWLEAWEILRLDIDADLVVLSACDTARGRIGGGEGVVGMAWSFFVAGARTTLATQWKVSSESSADLMIAFHESLGRRGPNVALRKAKSLRDAQLAMIRSGRYEHPFYWAAFVILGDAS